MLEAPKMQLQKTLQAVIGVVERKQTMAILGNVLMRVADKTLTLTATDLEIELTATCEIEHPGELSITLPGRKLLDILKAWPDDAIVKLEIKENEAILKAGRSRFKLATLKPGDFPILDDFKPLETITLPQLQLRAQVDNTQFAMSNQDVRYYLNGLFFEFNGTRLNTVATDGHRLAFNSGNGIDRSPDELRQIILPRKGVFELSRLLSSAESDTVAVSIGDSHLMAELANVRFVSKLIDGKFPDYHRAIPADVPKVVTADRAELIDALSRTAILSSDKKGVRLMLTANQLAMQSNNMEQETADEELAVEYAGAPMEIGFCVTYLLDALSHVSGEQVNLCFSDSANSCLIRDPENEDSQFVVSPMRL